MSRNGWRSLAVCVFLGALFWGALVALVSDPLMDITQRVHLDFIHYCQTHYRHHHAPEPRADPAEVG